MEKKLNNEQRKMLAKIYMDRLAKRDSELTLEYNANREKIINKMVQQEQQRPVVAKMFKLYKEYAEQVSKVKELYANDKLCQFGAYISNSDPTISVVYNVSTPELEKLHTAYMAECNKITEAKQTILSMIYGLDATYTQVDKTINSVLAGL